MNNDTFDLSGKRVWITGHRGMVGSALVRHLATENCDVLTAARDQLDLTNQKSVDDWVAENKPDVIFLAAAKVGGIAANDTRPAEFIGENLLIQTHVIDAAWRNGVKKLVFLGSSCIYPRDAAQPMDEDSLLTGPLEPTNQWYAVAKIAGIKMCQAYRRQYGCDFISAQPTNLYGPGDTFDLQGSHVIPALIMKAHSAKTAGDPAVRIWGSGKPLREFLHVEDLADALIFLAKHYSDEMPINIGSGSEVSIRELAETVCAVVGFAGALEFDSGMPDGTPRKLVSTDRLHAMGWNRARDLEAGLRETYQWYCGTLGETP